ncbi:neuronal acetylcholine receptor subunit alpha-10 [Elysia marginata]|uniref:Neuronal acetylcholine receptor subunit alpha-10 n=1 Tax=Elysia marginata TaxID=1093978 RepID=A0AAV4H6D7_9GAST|nr:neuronal acetylcholine receptor subunit alpha-10 [Elysia marginata]
MIGLAILFILVLRLTIQAAILNHQNNIAFNNKGQHMHLSVKPAHLIHTLTDENFNGDFNDCPRKTLLPFLHQLVDTPTRGDNCLDLLFTNIPNSHVSKKLWALGSSDHSLVYLRPKAMRHREQPKQKTVLVRTPEIWDELRACFDCTDWNVFVNSTADVSELADTVCAYINADDFTTGYMKSKAMVYSNGTVFWAPPARFRSSCKIDITYFPFDDQSCELKFGSWTYDGFQVDVTNRTSRVDLQNYVYSGEWELMDVRIRRTVVKYACCDETYPDVRFTVVIRRKTLYYLFNIIFPCLWLTILSLLGFWLPPESGEKITLGITVLLAFSVFMLLIAESMPATSEFVPLMGNGL